MKKIKRILSMLMVCCLVVGMLPLPAIATSISFAGGDGTADNPYQIATVEQLDAIRDNLSVNYILINDIDLSGIFPWKPIGTSSNPFKGTLDGAGYTIKNLNLSRGSGTNVSDGGVLGGIYNWIGLFGYTYSSTMKNLNISINSCARTTNGNRIFLGGLVGYAVESKIENINVSGGPLTADPGDSVYHGGYVGGIVGYASDTSIMDSHNICDVSIERANLYDAFAGGITGYGGIISRCSNNGDISAPYVSCADAYVGGISGKNATISECYNIGNISSKVVESYENCYAGGLVGYNGSVANSYNTGNVSTMGDANIYIGGVFSAGTKVSHSYNIGKLNKKGVAVENPYYISGINDRQSRQSSGNAHPWQRPCRFWTPPA